jgi:hypothetical protein
MASCIVLVVIMGISGGAFVSLQAPLAVKTATDMRFGGTMVGQALCMSGQSFLCDSADQIQLCNHSPSSSVDLSSAPCLVLGAKPVDSLGSHTPSSLERSCSSLPPHLSRVRAIKLSDGRFVSRHSPASNKISDWTSVQPYIRQIMYTVLIYSYDPIQRSKGRVTPLLALSLASSITLIPQSEVSLLITGSISPLIAR